MAWPRLCVTTIKVSAGASVLSSASMDSVVTGSRDEVGSSSSRTSGPDGEGARQAEQLLLAARQPEGRVVQAVLDRVPQPDLGEAALAHHVELLALGDAVRLHPGHDVVLDRHRERVRPLEQHADAPPQRQEVDVLRPQALVVQRHVALAHESGHAVVHAVEGAQEGGLARARRPDERRDGAALEVHVDVVHHDPAREAEAQVDRAHDALGSLRVGIEGLQRPVDIGLCLGRHGIETCLGDSRRRPLPGP